MEYDRMKCNPLETKNEALFLFFLQDSKIQKKILNIILVTKVTIYFDEMQTNILNTYYR